MTYEERLVRRTVGISISEAEDLTSLGFGAGHLRDAAGEIARHLLALGARLVYAGDLRAHGFTELLIELVARHRRDSSDARLPITNFLPWPVHIGWSLKEIDDVVQNVEAVADLEFLDVEGQTLSPRGRRKLRARTPTTRDWRRGLTTARERLARESNARIVLGGRLGGFRGSLPGIVEEALMAMRARQPLYVVGGFGGCARAIAYALGLIPGSPSAAGRTAGSEFNGFTPSDLRNGLTRHENETLARTPHIEEAVALILRGLAARTPRTRHS